MKIFGTCSKTAPKPIWVLFWRKLYFSLSLFYRNDLWKFIVQKLGKIRSCRFNRKCSSLQNLQLWFLDRSLKCFQIALKWGFSAVLGFWKIEIEKEKEITRLSFSPWPKASPARFSARAPRRARSRARSRLALVEPHRVAAGHRRWWAVAALRSEPRPAPFTPLHSSFLHARTHRHVEAAHWWRGAVPAPTRHVWP
jgi:hypothetical protein